MASPQQENSYQDIIDLIHRFPLSTKFFQWLGNEDIVFNVFIEKAHHDLYERLAEYTLDNLRIYSGGGQVKLEQIPESFRTKLFLMPKQFYPFLPELLKLEKRELSHSIEGSNYTVISQFYNQGALCGSIWEIYDLPNLKQVCKKRRKI